jgi:hypothetical protein
VAFNTGHTGVQDEVREAVRDLEGAPEGAALGEGFDGVATGRCSRGVASIASGMEDLPGQLWGDAIAPTAARSAAPECVARRDG